MSNKKAFLPDGHCTTNKIPWLSCGFH